MPDVKSAPQSLSIASDQRLLAALSIIETKCPHGIAGLLSQPSIEVINQAGKTRCELPSTLDKLRAIEDPVDRVMATAYLFDRVRLAQQAIDNFQTAKDAGLIDVRKQSEFLRLEFGKRLLESDKLAKLLNQPLQFAIISRVKSKE